MKATHVKVPLPSGRFALIDAYQWHFVVRLEAGRRYDYAIGIGTTDDAHRRIFMQNLIFGVDPSMPIRHISSNTLDNTRDNLSLPAEYF